MPWISGVCGEALTALRLECSDPLASETDPWCAYDIRKLSMLVTVSDTLRSIHLTSFNK